MSFLDHRLAETGHLTQHTDVLIETLARSRSDGSLT